MKQSDKIYRIGLFGRSNAGKTTFLAALNQLRSAVVDGNTWTISYLKPVKGEIDDQGLFTKLDRGRKLLEEATQAIETNGSPAPTMEDQKTTLYRFQIACGGSKRIVELIDYAGEVIALSRLSDIESDGFQLAKRIAQCDAAFVLAPATVDDTATVANPREVTGLDDGVRNDEAAQGLAQLHDWMCKHDELKDIRQMPFGLLVTKADLASEIASDVLIDYGTASGLVWEKISGLFGKEFTRWFGISTVHPKSAGSNLVEPIVWAMDQSDKQLVAYGELENEVGYVSWLSSPNQVGGKKRRAIRLVSGVIGRRCPSEDHPDSIASTASQTKRSLSQFVRRYRVGSGVAVFATIWLAVSFGDWVWTAGHRRTALAASSADEELRSAEAYFQDYRTRKLSLSLFSIGGKRADELRNDCRTTLADRMWQSIQADADSIRQGVNAQQLIDKYPESPYRMEAAKLVENANRLTAERDYDQWFANILKKRKLPDLSIAQREELISSLTGAPLGLVENQTQSKSRKDLLAELQNEQKRVLQTTERLKFKELVESLLDANQPFDALEKFEGRPEAIQWSELKPTVTRMRANWMASVINRIAEFQHNDQFEDGIAALDRANSDFDSIGGSLELANQPSLISLKLKLRQAWDESEYEDFIQRPSKDAADDYLNAAHTRCMSQTVSKWRAWELTKSKPFRLRPHLVSFTWDETKGAYDPMVTFEVNGKEILKQVTLGGGGIGETFPLKPTKTSFNLKTNDSIDVVIKLYNDDIIWDNLVKLYRGSFPVSELLTEKGKEGFIRTTDATHAFRIRLLDMPTAPELLEWRACQ